MMERLKWTLWVLMLLPLVLATGCDSIIEVRMVTQTATPALSAPTLTPGTTAPSPTPVDGVATPTSTPIPTSESPTATPEPPTPTAEPEPTRIQFEPGATSATVTGHIEQNGLRLYVLRALASQTMEVLIASPNAVSISIWGADGAIVKRYGDEETEWRGELPSTQDYFIGVTSTQETNYTLIVTIPPLTPQPSITVISPNGGEEWMEGNTYDIVWTSSDVDEIDIGVAAGGKDLGMIAFGIDAQSGRYSWEIPVGLISNFGVPKSDSMRVRITDSRDPNIYDENDSYFTVMCPRIRFEPGATSAIVTGHIEQNGAERYVLRAFAGQTMEVVVTSPSGDVGLSIWGADGVSLKRSADDRADWRGVLPSTQDYFIQVVSVQATSYVLTVIISPLEPEPRRIQFAPGATSAVIEGRLETGVPDRYALRALRGQRMEVEVRVPPTATVNIMVEGQDGSFWSGLSSEGPLTIEELPATQDYIITLALPIPLAGAISYTMEVRIPPP